MYGNHTHKGNEMDEELMDEEELMEQQEEKATEIEQQCEFKFAWIALLDQDREARD